ncbi:MAG: N-formylglutamate amidohydrolase [Rhizobiaceae bacterium]
MCANEWSPVKLYNTIGAAPVVLICEHASFSLPRDLVSTALDTATGNSHVAGDLGALAVAKSLSSRLNAPLVFGGVSRLIYDCNRPFSAPDCIPQKSEVFEIPFNAGLTLSQRQARYDLVHQPFHHAVGELIRSQRNKVNGPVTVITIHSFTPQYNGHQRHVELGFLHGKNADLSKITNEIEQKRGVYLSNLNEPYAASDGVTYTLDKHTGEEGVNGTMIEIRNDLIATDASAEAMADHLAKTLNDAMLALNYRLESVA